MFGFGIHIAYIKIVEKSKHFKTIINTVYQNCTIVYLNFVKLFYNIKLYSLIIAYHKIHM